MKVNKKTGGNKNRLFSVKKEEWKLYLLLVCFAVSVVMLITDGLKRQKEEKAFAKQQQELQQQKLQQQQLKEQLQIQKEPQQQEQLNGATKAEATAQKLQILPEYQMLYHKNQDIVGWLSIKDTKIDYPVMQTMEEEQYYLNKNFAKEEDNMGCLILDTESKVGLGSRESGYQEGDPPSTNLIIHGHNTISGAMFGELDLYNDEAYGKEHQIICFDSLYEKRTYELIAVFYSRVYYQHENVFKYYQFFQANTRKEFESWYRNIKKLALYDTGVSAEFGDEFITLSTCAYHVEDGRLVVVGKRITE